MFYHFNLLQNNLLSDLKIPYIGLKNQYLIFELLVSIEKLFFFIYNVCYRYEFFLPRSHHIMKIHVAE